MIRQFLIVLAAAAVLMFPVTALAQKGGRSHSSSHTSSASKGSGTSKPVHVKAFTKKDGTTVEAHDRRAPSPSSAAKPPSIRTYTDPVSGRRTFTNAPLPMPPEQPTVANSLHSTPAHKATTTSHTIRVPTQRTTTTAAHPRAVAPPASSGTAVSRSANGKIARSEAAKHRFETQSGYPHGRPGYVVDHIKPLACGGADAPSNMQWQTVAEAKSKDKVERIGCR